MKKGIAVLIGMLLLFAALMLFGCNSASKLQRKEDKVFNEATASRERLQRIAPVVLGLWPCANDTAFVFKAGRIDSIAYPVLFDTTDREKIRDSVLLAELPFYEDKCNEAVKQAYDQGVKWATNQISKLKLPVKRADTLQTVVVDRRLLKAADDSFFAVVGREKMYKGAAAQWQKQAENSTKEKGKILLFAGLAIVLLAVALGLAIAFIFKRRMPV